MPFSAGLKSCWRMGREGKRDWFSHLARVPLLEERKEELK